MDISSLALYSQLQKIELTSLIYATETLQNDPAFSALPRKEQEHILKKLCHKTTAEISQESREEFITSLEENNKLRKTYIHGYQ